MQAGNHIEKSRLDDAILAWTQELAPHGVFTTDSNLNLTSWNQWLERHSSLPAREVIGRPLTEIVPSLSERGLERYFRDALKGEAKILSTALHKYLLPMPPAVHASGLVHMQQSARIAPLMLDGKVWGTIALVEDVTEREWQSAVIRGEHQRDILLAAALRQLLSNRNQELPVNDIFSQISGYLRLDACLHHRFEERGQCLLLQTAIGLAPQQMEDVALFQLGEGLIGAAAKKQHLIVVADVQASEDPKAVVFKGLGMGTFLVFPLAVAQKLLGTIAFGTHRQGNFSAQEVAFLQSISQFFAVAFERIIHEQGLRESEQRFRALAETIPDVIFTSTPGGRCDFINQRFGGLTGLPPDKALGFGWMQAIHPDDLKAVQEKWRRSIESGEEFNSEYRLRLESGDYRWMVSRARAVPDESGKTSKWFGAVTDVHQLKETQFELSEARNQLECHAAGLEKTVSERTARLRETISHLEGFSYTVAHDLRAPIRAMEGYTALILEDYAAGLPDEVTTILQRVRRAAQRLDALTADVLSYTKLSTEHVELKPVNVEALLRDILDMNPALQAPRASIAMVRPLHHVLGHPTLLSQCLSNLLDNAVKFVRPDQEPRIIVRSEISIPSEGLEKNETPGEHPRKPREVVRIWVEDNGIGIDELTRKKIFGIFERGIISDRYPGTGIGLAIVAKTVQRMGGKYGVESELDAGSIMSGREDLRQGYVGIDTRGGRIAILMHVFHLLRSRSI